MRILMASDGSGHARAAALYGALIARPARVDVTLLGVVEARHNEDDLANALAALRDEVAQGGACRVDLKLRHGVPDEQILAESGEHLYHLAVVGSQAGRRLGFFMGSTARRLARTVKVPLLIVAQPRPALRRLLICTSGEKPGETNALVGGTLAALVGAEATALHVMSQIALTPGAPLEDLERDAPDLIARGTREGKHLQRVLEIMAGQGLDEAHRQVRVRHGLVLDEMLSEVRDGDYDLVVIGAHQVPEDLPWRGLRELIQENIADQIVIHVRRPLLVVRALDEKEWATSLTGPGKTGEA